MMSGLNRQVLLSIITVARNDFTRLGATINSLNDLYGDDRFEHVVVDGKSTDDKTLELVLQTAKHKNYKFLSEPDEGIYDAMNKGARLASGRYLLFLNCGDQLVASPVQLDAWITSLDQETGVDVACFGCKVRQGARVTVLQARAGTRHKMPTSHQAMLFSKGFVASHPYDIQYRIAADFNLYLSADSKRTRAFQEGPLTEIEAVGLASESPAQSYREYLQIAYRHLRGWVRWIAIVRIGCKGMLVIALKKTLPRAWVHGLRRIV